MKQTIGFFVHSPASANNAYALWKVLKEEYQTEVFTFHPFAQQLFQATKMYTYEDLATLIHASRFDVIITGTGSMHPVERAVPLLAKQQHIHCISILDCFWMDDDNLRRRFDHTPDVITAPNADVKKRLVSLLDVAEDRVLAIGVPHLDRLKAYQQKEMDTYYDSVAFFSTCSTHEDFSDTHPKAKEALEELALWITKNSQYKQVTVTKHPREDGKWIQAFCEKHSSFIFTADDSWNVLLRSNIVFGLPSALLHESVIIQKPAVMYEKKGDIVCFSLEHATQKESPVSSFQATEQLADYIRTFLLTRR